MKLAQVIALITNLPRRKAIELIDRSLVKVNGEICLQYSFPVDPAKDIIEVQGFKNAPKKFDEKHYFIFHKPKGIITSLNGHRNALNRFIEEIGCLNLKPVGRLDQDSEGLLILTDDGDLIQRLTHPKNHVPKKYLVWVSGLRDSSGELQEQIENLQNLLTITSLKKVKELTVLEIELKEGQNRQIRRACAQVGLYVERILRIAIGAVQLGKLKPSHWKELSSNTVKFLFP